MDTTPKLMTRRETENQWGLYEAAVGNISTEKLHKLAWASVPVLADEIRQMDVFDFEKHTDHAIAYAVRHAALLRLMSLEHQEVAALDRETVDEIYTQAREVAERRFSPSNGRCQYCDTKKGDEAGGLHLLFDWDNLQPGDVLWDGEAWLACRECNWDYLNGRPVIAPENSIIVEGKSWSRTAYWYIILSKIEKGENVT